MNGSTYTSTEIARWVCGNWNSADREFPVSGISHDTRTLNPGEVYIALRGAVHDGHRFVEQAVEKGAAGLIVEREYPAIDLPQLAVPASMGALWQLAAGVRAGWTGTVTGITGSAGKTTVKEMTAAVLSQKGAVARTIGNWNNEIGLPLSMLAADRHADFYVFELGMNHPGEIDRLAALLRPDRGAITTIGKAHIGFFKSLEAIAGEKAALLNHCARAVLDIESEWFGRLTDSFCGTIVPLTHHPFRVAQPGLHMIQNARFAATIGLDSGLSSAEIQKGLDLFCPPPMRWQTIKKDDVLFINDAYNANPLSMRAALSAFAELPCTGRRFAILGAMHELGRASEAEHRELGDFTRRLGLDGVFTVGEQGRWIDSAGGVTKEEVVRQLNKVLRPGDAVFLKASRSEQFETILDELTRGN
jgi:UDP-N-acetylmuramoyl-tripeptide--D-alanyl-D-alanine ligase